LFNQQPSPETPLPKAHWNGAVIAESEAVEKVEGNAYFPPEAVDRAKLRPSDTKTNCPWKGEASYYDVVVGDEVNRDAAWYYPEPKSAASQIKDHVAFWRGVIIDD
jgi:uncharacterized protein (DUF427 family)